MIINQQKNADYESDNVKDKENLLSFNQWSATEYLNNLNEFVNLGSPSVANPSKDYPTIGEQCIYFTINSNHWWFGLNLDNISTTGNYTFSCNIYSNKGVLVRLLDSNNNTISSISSNTGKTTISVSGLLQNTSGNYIHFLMYGEGAESYIDNLQLIHQ